MTRDKITLGIWTDIRLDGEQEEEWADIEEELRDIGLNIGKVVADTNPIPVAEANPDLLVLDYGGMAEAGCRDTMIYNARYFCRWAEAHPNTLVIIWTYFSAALYKAELQSEFIHLDNIVLHMGIVMNDALLEKIRTWFGLQT